MKVLSLTNDDIVRTRHIYQYVETVICVNAANSAASLPVEVVISGGSECGCETFRINTLVTDEGISPGQHSDGANATVQRQDSSVSEHAGRCV